MATTLNMINGSGDQIDSVDVSPSWLERDRGDQAVHDSVVAFLARNRAGTASSKTRGMVRGTGAKPYRQKGTGRARAGTRKSPIWRGGGVTFGPSPRSFAKKLNRKIERLALRRAFTERLDDGSVILVDDLTLETPKTKQAAALLAQIGAGEDALIVVQEMTPNLEIATRNLPGVVVMLASSVNTYWMLLFSKIVVTKAGLEVLGSRIAGKETAE